MLLWLMFAVLTTAVVIAVLRPTVSTSARVVSAERSPDVAVYADQLADLEHQVARGQLDASESSALRHEISRRILRASPAINTLAPDQSNAAKVGMAACLAVPVVCVGLYLHLGSPGVPGRPFVAERAPNAAASAAELIAKVEARLATNPDDGRGWDVIAPVYFRLERYSDAADAFANAVRLLGESTARLAGFAEATVLANDGIVTEPARAAYQKLRLTNPERFEPRFWLALALEQDGKRDAAAAEYRALLSSAPADIQWRSMVEQRLQAVSQNSASSRGPTQSDIAAAAALSEVDRSAMINTMVENLATRLKTNRQDLEGWQKLIRAYVTLKKPERAQAAFADARAAFATDPAATGKLNELARLLELKP